jgi:ATP/maltotriose-dependent transcriptional regulator MalT
MKLADVNKIIAELESRYKEDEIATCDVEGKARSLRTHLSHDKKVLDAWKAHAAALKDAGEFH